MAVADRNGLPITVCTESATPHEVKLVMQTLAEIFVEEPVQRLIGDNAYDSDQLDRELAETGVEMIAPHRRNRTNLTQDGRPLRRIVTDGRLNGCLHGSRIIVGWSRATSITWRTSRTCSISLAPSSCSAIYEMGSNLRTIFTDRSYHEARFNC